MADDSSCRTPRVRRYLFGALRRPAKMPVDDFFRELNAVVLQQTWRLFQPAVERHLHLPRTGEDLLILDRDVVLEGVRTDRRISLGHPQGVAVKIPGAVEPGLIVETGRIDDER